MVLLVYTAIGRTRESLLAALLPLYPSPPQLLFELSHYSSPTAGAETKSAMWGDVGDGHNLFIRRVSIVLAGLAFKAGTVDKNVPPLCSEL